MTKEERDKKLELFLSGYDNMKAALQKYPEEMWKYRLAPDKWSIHEIVVHIADSEVYGFGRFRKAVAEPGVTVDVYDQDAWVNSFDYHDFSTEDALELFRYLRINTYNMLKKIPEKTWKNTIVHPEGGEVTMEFLLGMYEDHIPVHILQMDRNLEAWQNK